MNDFITIDVSQFTNLGSNLTLLKDKIGQVVDDVLNAGAQDIARAAKDRAPKNFGGAGLTGSISAVNDIFLEKHITANKFYAPFMEFGTGKYAAAEVSKLPADWQTYAAKFRQEEKTGTFEQLLKNITEWVERKGITAIYSVKTQRRKKVNADETKRIKQVAYLIARSIVINGVRPHPFMFPAYEENRPLIIKKVETAIKGLGV
ncbi:MAG: HK97 gp10 family phage protein [Parafilimonas sp.]